MNELPGARSFKLMSQSSAGRFTWSMLTAIGIDLTQARIWEQARGIELGRNPHMTHEIAGCMAGVCNGLEFDIIAYTAPDMALAHQLGLNLMEYPIAVELVATSRAPLGFGLRVGEPNLVRGQRVLIVAGLTASPNAVANMVRLLRGHEAIVTNVAMIIDAISGMDLDFDPPSIAIHAPIC